MTIRTVSNDDNQASTKRNGESEKKPNTVAIVYPPKMCQHKKSECDLLSMEKYAAIKSKLRPRSVSCSASLLFSCSEYFQFHYKAYQCQGQLDNLTERAQAYNSNNIVNVWPHSNSGHDPNVQGNLSAQTVAHRVRFSGNWNKISAEQGSTEQKWPPKTKLSRNKAQARQNLVSHPQKSLADINIAASLFEMGKLYATLNEGRESVQSSESQHPQEKTQRPKSILKRSLHPLTPDEEPFIMEDISVPQRRYNWLRTVRLLEKNLEREEWLQKFQQLKNEQQNQPRNQQYKPKEQWWKPNGKLSRSKQQQCKSKEQLCKLNEQQGKSKEQLCKPNEQQGKSKEQLFKLNEQSKPNEQQCKPNEEIKPNEQTKANEQQCKPNVQQSNQNEEQCKPSEQHCKPKEQYFKPNEQQFKPKGQQYKLKQQCNPREEQLKLKEQQLKLPIFQQQPGKPAPGKCTQAGPIKQQNPPNQYLVPRHTPEQKQQWRSSTNIKSDGKLAAQPSLQRVKPISSIINVRKNEHRLRPKLAACETNILVRDFQSGSLSARLHMNKSQSLQKATKVRPASQGQSHLLTRSSNSCHRSM